MELRRTIPALTVQAVGTATRFYRDRSGPVIGYDDGERRRTRRPRPGAVLLILAACAGAPPVPAIPSTTCAPVWADSATAELVEELVRVTGTGRPVWGDYDLGDGWFVVYAGESAPGGACLGAVKGGRVVAYGELADAPRLPTPLYGFYLPAGTDGAVPTRNEQPASVTSWLESVDVGRATIVPVAIEDFPMELSTLAKLQVALHEGFHVQVQSPHWSGSAKGWPRWDRQPDRAGLQACYGGTEVVASSVAQEREALARTVEALLDDDGATACRAGADFLAQRAARYDMLRDVRVARHDSTPGTCREAEAIMELEEGTADYASWTVLYELGRTSRDRLMGRYRAVQDDVFYLTGAMQLHALALIEPDGMEEVARRIGASRSPETGSITALFADALDGYCRSSRREPRTPS